MQTLKSISRYWFKRLHIMYILVLILYISLIFGHKLIIELKSCFSITEPTNISTSMIIIFHIYGQMSSKWNGLGQDLRNTMYIIYMTLFSWIFRYCFMRLHIMYILVLISSLHEEDKTMIVDIWIKHTIPPQGSKNRRVWIMQKVKKKEGEHRPTR